MDKPSFFIELNYFEYCFFLKKYLAEVNIDIDTFIKEHGADILKNWENSIAPRECIRVILSENERYNSSDIILPVNIDKSVETLSKIQVQLVNSDMNTVDFNKASEMIGDLKEFLVSCDSHKDII